MYKEGGPSAIVQLAISATVGINHTGCGVMGYEEEEAGQRAEGELEGGGGGIRRERRV